MNDGKKERNKTYALKLAHEDLMIRYNQGLEVIRYFMAGANLQDQDNYMALLDAFEKSLSQTLPTPDDIVARAKVFYDFLEQPAQP